MKKTVLAIAVASLIGSVACDDAEAGTVGLTGVWMGGYSFSMLSPAGALAGTPTEPQAWAFDFDAGTVSISNTSTFFSVVWTAYDVTITDNGDGTYGNAIGDGVNMLFDFSVSTFIPVEALWEITDNGDGSASVVALSSKIPSSSMHFPDFQPTFNGTLYAPVPIPAAAYLFGSGLLGLIGVSRRRRKQ